MGFMPKRGLDVSKCEIARSAVFALLACTSVPTCHRERRRGFSNSVIFGKEWGYFAGGGLSNRLVSMTAPALTFSKLQFPHV